MNLCDFLCKKGRQCSPFPVYHVYHVFPRGKYLGRAIRTDRYRMVEWKNRNDANDVLYELYDYKLDPLETKNVAKEQPKVLARMKEILAKHPAAK